MESIHAKLRANWRKYYHIGQPMHAALPARLAIWHQSEQNAVNAKRNDVSLQNNGTKPSLLIVDDDPLITDTLNFVLSRDLKVFERIRAIKSKAC